MVGRKEILLRKIILNIHSLGLVIYFFLTFVEVSLFQPEMCSGLAKSGMAIMSSYKYQFRFCPHKVQKDIKSSATCSLLSKSGFVSTFTTSTDTRVHSPLVSEETNAEFVHWMNTISVTSFHAHPVPLNQTMTASRVMAFLSTCCFCKINRC